MHNDRHLEVMRGLVRGCLDDLDQLVTVFLAEVHRIEPYREQLVPVEEMHEHAEASLEMLLRMIGELPIPDRLTGVPETVGRRRAQLGVPIDSLLRAVRLDFRVLWTAMVARIGSDADSEALVRHGAMRVSDAVEQHMMRIHLSYLDEAALLAAERERERERLVAQLIAGDGRDPQVVGQVARALRVAAADRFLVAAVPSAAQRAMRAAMDRLAAAGVVVYPHELAQRTVLIAACGAAGDDLAAELREVPCGLGPIADGLGEVPRAVRVAVRIADVLPTSTTEPRQLVDVWPALAATHLAETGEVLGDTVLSGLDSVTSYERARLVETVRAYLASGSVREVAAQLFCHRNTVLNRLNRFHELTGQDVNRPKDAALVLVALACVD
ncbi:PucR-like helix-turn-helix protein [Tamaricihabitans halophyticus]|uniref:PucR-like helix-turn-helix protein n=1 Tax=Tamaricihabitans halophyticus TaxID=1262583 RepID=A0A4R2QDT4_9PSEU|nr:helix-turn-helix domain-containing protein [Tamaricihabitans halophyticus]TCP47222.1 PucR-like helix-turn-helix protein [Tamaricihabitans halophyticus]